MRINQSNLVIKLLQSLNDPSEFWQSRIHLLALYGSNKLKKLLGEVVQKKEIPRLPLCVKLVRNRFGVVSKATGQPGDEIISDAPFQKIITPASVGRWVEALVYVMGPLTHSNSHYTGGAAALICSRRRLAHD